MGSVLFFDDVSQIAKVERMEAWREVARRIAHEIKNPLTPIQLSAERLRRQLGPRLGNESGLLEECTKTIISEVQDLKHLVNEFSAFARMPHLVLVEGDLNALAAEVVAGFEAAHPGVDFRLRVEKNLPRVALDRDAMKRVMVNLIDNAIAAAATANHNGERPRIDVITSADAANGILTLEIRDNGPGIPPALRSRIFEPYFSTKATGTGLGLAIVSAVITDHHGFVRIADNPPRGSRFIMEFPLKVAEIAKAAG